MSSCISAFSELAYCLCSIVQGNFRLMSTVLRAPFLCRWNVLCAPMPAESAWATAMHEAPGTGPAPLPDASTSDGAAAAAAASSLGDEAGTETGRKRRRQHGTEASAAMAEDTDSDGDGDEEEDGAAAAKRLAMSPDESSTASTAPLPAAASSTAAAGPALAASASFGAGISCLLRIYGAGSDGAPLRVGDAVEVIGILTTDSGVMPRQQRPGGSSGIADSLSAGAGSGAGAGEGAGAGAAHPMASDAARGHHHDHHHDHDHDDGCAIDDDEEERFAGAESELPAASVPRLQVLLMRPLGPSYPVYQPRMATPADIVLPPPPSARPVKKGAASERAAVIAAAAAAAASGTGPVTAESLRASGAQSSGAAAAAPQADASAEAAPPVKLPRCQVRPFAFTSPSGAAALGLHAGVGSAVALTSASAAVSTSSGASISGAGAGADASADPQYREAVAHALRRPEVVHGALAAARKSASERSALAAFNAAFGRGSGASAGAGEAAASAAAAVSAPTLTVEAVRAEIIRALATSVGGDALVAEVLLLHLLSGVTGKPESDVHVLGKLSLCVTGFPDAALAAPAAAAAAPAAAAVAAGKTSKTVGPPLPPGAAAAASAAATRLHRLLADLVPRELLLPISIGLLNASRFAPRKDAEDERLAPGALQLPPGSHVTVDATVMGAGKLSGVGTQNLPDLQTVIGDAALPCRFAFHTQKLPVGTSICHTIQFCLALDAVFPILSRVSSLLALMLLRPVHCRHPSACAFQRPTAPPMRYGAALSS